MRRPILTPHNRDLIIHLRRGPGGGWAFDYSLRGNPSRHYGGGIFPGTMGIDLGNERIDVSWEDDGSSYKSAGYESAIDQDRRLRELSNSVGQFFGKYKFPRTEEESRLARILMAMMPGAEYVGVRKVKGRMVFQVYLGGDPFGYVQSNAENSQVFTVELESEHDTDVIKSSLAEVFKPESLEIIEQHDGTYDLLMRQCSHIEVKSGEMRVETKDEDLTRYGRLRKITGSSGEPYVELLVEIDQLEQIYQRRAKDAEETAQVTKYMQWTLVGLLGLFLWWFL